MIELTKKQKEGVLIARERFLNKEKYTVISGYAGTGKSTLISYLIEELNLEGEVTYATYTGKASLVLREKGIPSQTLHKLIYNTFINEETGEFIHRKKTKKEMDMYEIIVVDEVSMCPKNIWETLLSFNVHIIALGDPFQLPPIGEDNGILSSPHIFLDEVMRQALESDIIKVSMDIRNGKKLTPFEGNDIKVVRRQDMVAGMYFWADQVLCGLNKTRRFINKTMREAEGRFGDMPEYGDKIICLRNYWDKKTSEGAPLINGMIGTVKGTFSKNNKQSLILNIEYDNSTIKIENIDKKIFETGSPTAYSRGVVSPVQLDYGSCITVWKSQGSQFNKVLFFAERVGPMSDLDYAKFLYTGLTRAVSKVIIII